MQTSSSRSRRLTGAAGLIALMLVGCHSMLLTSREHVSLYPEKLEMELGAKAHAEILQTEPKSQNAHLKEMVTRVGRRIAAVSERPDFQWEFTLLAGPSQNAYCLPGGKVVVYEGLLPICQNEAGLAVVMSHEIAHALARHGGERMSHDASDEEAPWTPHRLWRERDTEQIDKLKTAYGVSSKGSVQLPFSRTQESEADSIGLNLMARAGYDPEEAIRFWGRFGKSSGPLPPALLATHPSDEHRTAQLKELVPRAMAVYQGVPQRHGLGEQFPMQPLSSLAQKITTPAAPVVAAVAPPAAALSTAALEAAPTTPVKTPGEAPVAVTSVEPPPSSTALAITALSVAPAPIVSAAPAKELAAQAIPSPAEPGSIQPASAEAVSGEGVTTPETANADGWVPHTEPESR